MLTASRQTPFFAKRRSPPERVVRNQRAAIGCTEGLRSDGDGGSRRRSQQRQRDARHSAGGALGDGGDSIDRARGCWWSEEGHGVALEWCWTRKQQLGQTRRPEAVRRVNVLGFRDRISGTQDRTTPQLLLEPAAGPAVGGAPITKCCGCPQRRCTRDAQLAKGTLLQNSTLGRRQTPPNASPLSRLPSTGPLALGSLIARELGAAAW